MCWAPIGIRGLLTNPTHDLTHSLTHTPKIARKPVRASRNRAGILLFQGFAFGMSRGASKVDGSHLRSHLRVLKKGGTPRATQKGLALLQCKVSKCKSVRTLQTSAKRSQFSHNAKEYQGDMYDAPESECLKTIRPWMGSEHFSIHGLVDSDCALKRSVLMGEMDPPSKKQQLRCQTAGASNCYIVSPIIKVLTQQA